MQRRDLLLSPFAALLGSCFPAITRRKIRSKLKIGTVDQSPGAPIPEAYRSEEERKDLTMIRLGRK
jgi:hypothetical protein